MAYKYDPILCMMVEKPNVKTNDKAGEMWYLYVDGKSITAFESWGAPVKEAKEYMKKNNIKGVGTLKRIGRGGSFTITAKDEAPVEKSKAKDADKYTEKAIELLKQGKTKNEVIFALQRMGLTPVDASQRLGKAFIETGLKHNDSISSIDKAIKAVDKFTVWESDEYDDIYVSYEGGTYVLYVDGRPQADGPQQRMIQLAKQEERMRG